MVGGEVEADEEEEGEEWIGDEVGAGGEEGWWAELGGEDIWWWEK